MNGILHHPAVYHGSYLVALPEVFSDFQSAATHIFAAVLTHVDRNSGING